MKKGWICRTSYEEIVHTWWWLVEIQIQLWWLWEIQIEWWSRSSSDDPDREMIQIEWWSRSSPVMMIQIEWWSGSCDDVLWWSRSRDDPDPDDLKMKMNWRWRWLEDEDDPVDTEKKTSAEKLCRKNTFLVKRECWCICNFGMYSSMYCNPMFIPGCFYYVFESYCLTPMFRSGGLLM